MTDFDASLLSKIATYTEILSQDSHSTAFVPLSDAYRQMGLLDDALEVAEKGVKAQPRFSPGYIILGRVLFELGNFPAAATSFEKAYILDPENSAAIRGWARVLERQGNTMRAREILERGLVSNQNDAGLAKMLSSLPIPSKLEESLSSTPRPAKAKEPIATTTIAEIYLQQGYLDRALKVYLDLQANHPEDQNLKNKIVEVTKLIATKDAKSSANQVEVAETAQPIIRLANPSFSVRSTDSTACSVNEQSRTDQQIVLLTSWLNAIEGRRRHVQ